MTCIDASPGMIQQVKRKALAESLTIDARVGGLGELPAASFDGIISAFAALNTVADLRAFSEEAHRVLRPGGRALLFVPAFMFLWGVQDDISHHRRRYKLRELKQRVTDAGLSIERATYANISFFLPILIGRLLMRVTRIRPSSENNITIGAVNGLLGRILGAEGWWLQRMNFPFGVSIVCVARRDN